MLVKSRLLERSQVPMRSNLKFRIGAEFNRSVAKKSKEPLGNLNKGLYVQASFFLQLSEERVKLMKNHSQ